MSALILALAFEARDNSDALWVLGDAVLTLTQNRN